MWLVQDGEVFSVLEVVRDGAAARAGIEPGDRLMAIDGTKTADILSPAIRERWAKADDTTPVRVLAERAQKAPGIYRSFAGNSVDFISYGLDGE